MARTTAVARSATRLGHFVVVTALIIGLISVWAVWVQGIDAKGAAAKALARLQSKPQIIDATRGSIVDRNGVVLAQTLPYVRIIADPYGIVTNGIVRSQALTATQQDKATQVPLALANILMKYLGGSVDDYLGHLTCPTRDTGGPNQYEPVAANVPTYTWAKIQADMQAGGWYGLSAEQTPLRIYPDGTLMSNVLGFVGSDGNGLEGLELSANTGLKGVDGQASYESSIYGRIPLGDNTLVPPVNGNTYQLTIDAVMQSAAQQEIETAVTSSGSDYGTAIVMNVKTGEILAMANAPTYDDNSFGSAPSSDLGNRAIRSVYEPGSVQKILTVAALIDQGLITPDTKIVVPSKVKSGADTVTDSWSHSTLYMTVRGVVAHSSNVGTLLLSRLSTKANMVSYLQSFGLGQPTGIQLPGEATGQLDPNPPDYMRDRWAFGQSLSVTAIQEAAAVAAVVNGGVYHQPTIIASVTDANGNAVPQPEQVTRRVVSEETSAAVVNIMHAGTESSLYWSTRQIPGYSWAGKTGTAQRYDPATGRYKGTTASFMAVGPTEDPTYLVYVVLDNPNDGAAGASVAMPPAKDLMQVALPRYGVQPGHPTMDKDALTYKP